jgi:2-methylisocitrate lyase-like PEP mutase family enzyme
MKNQQEKCEEFKKLHHAGQAFIIPNPWDIGSAKLLQGLGFKALATTSMGLAYTLGHSDYELPLESVLTFCEELAANTDVPVTVDFENGFAREPDEVAKNILRLAATGVAGCSIEDYDSSSQKIYDFALAVERIEAAVGAVTSLNMPFQLTARAENLLRGVDNVDDTIKRLQAFEAAGANVLYAPAIRTLVQLRLVTSELSLPFNVLAPFIKGATVAELQSHGATRISLGGALNWHAVNPVMRAGREMLENGTFGWMGDVATKDAVRDLLNRDRN